MTRYASMFIVFLEADDDGAARIEATRIIESGEARVITSEQMMGEHPEVIHIKTEQT